MCWIYWDTNDELVGDTGAERVNALIVLGERRLVHKCAGYIWTERINWLVILGQRG